MIVREMKLRISINASDITPSAAPTHQANGKFQSTNPPFLVMLNYLQNFHEYSRILSVSNEWDTRFCEHTKQNRSCQLKLDSF